MASASASGAASAPFFGKILQSKRDPSFHLFPIGKRIWDFFWEVLCQAKVVRERPLPGLAHAFVFWAFWLRPGHAESLRRHFRHRLSQSRRRVRPLLLLFSRSLRAGLRSRHPRPLHPPLFYPAQVAWPRSLLRVRRHCSLIFVLMATYLAAFFVADASNASRVLWWFHTLRCSRSAVDPAHQASAPGSQPGHRLSIARKFRPNPSALRATKTSASSPAQT